MPAKTWRSHFMRWQRNRLVELWFWPNRDGVRLKDIPVYRPTRRRSLVIALNPRVTRRSARVPIIGSIPI
ncbi:hypothetical protein LAUMK35_05631 [Mycobacterium pseudokansasii]|nr:hypothetical protein LAUMK35_05631 [Mycobacterium pseudokansasii]VBA35470.1 hypothetical protein LAUMK21_05591 [Mycobacterium pseudokansasii]